ncbi:MAG: hypothetical protein ABI343_04940 [Burkholderiaceae bacterium]
MVDSTSPDKVKPGRGVGVLRAGGYLLGALLLWLSVGWMIDFYVAQTAEERFASALHAGNWTKACVNAGIAADAYQVARDQHAWREWQQRRAEICKR